MPSDIPSLIRRRSNHLTRIADYPSAFLPPFLEESPGLVCMWAVTQNRGLVMQLYTVTAQNQCNNSKSAISQKVSSFASAKKE